jgi:hypothetical protein
MDLKEIRLKRVDWINLAHNRLVLAKTVMNLRIP